MKKEVLKVGPEYLTIKHTPLWWIANKGIIWELRVPGEWTKEAFLVELKKQVGKGILNGPEGK